MDPDKNTPSTDLPTGRTGLYAVHNKSTLNLRQTQKLLDSLDTIYGFDLAQVILLISKNQISGYLNIISEKNELYGVTFSEGQIVQIDNRDQKTFIGQLLVNDGYITDQELKDYLRNKNVRLGQELIETKKITKEQLTETLFKQTVLRLTQLINPKSVQISFTHVKVETNEIRITYEQIAELSFDWVFSCMTDQWLNMHYFENRNRLLKLSESSLKTQYFPTYQKICDLIGKDLIVLFQNKNKISTLDNEVVPQTLLRIIHQLVLIDSIEFIHSPSSTFQDKDLVHFLKQLRTAPPPEKLNALLLFSKCTSNETEKVYEKLVQKLENIKCDLEIKNNILKAAMNFLLNPVEMQLAKSGNTPAELEVISIKNEAKDLVYQKKYYQAFSILKKLTEAQMKSSKIELYALWCLLGHALDTDTKVDQQILKNRLAKIRPEDRYEAEYFYVLALYHKYIKLPNESEHFYLKSCAINPKFKEFKIKQDGIIQKIRQVLKFCLPIAILILSQKTQSEEIPPPIKFTNQYYSYTVAPNFIEVAGIKLNTQNISAAIEDLNMDPDGTCHKRITENSELVICKSTKIDQNLQVQISNMAVEKKGTVILQDLNEYIEFRIIQNNKKFLSLKLRRRAIAPFKVQKNAGETTAQFTFLDLKQRKNIWNSELSTDESTFRLELINEPYKIFQDFKYVSENPVAEEIDFTLKLPKEVQFSYNRLGLNALAGYSSFITNTSTFKSTLNSAVGKGLKFLYERNLGENSSVYTNLILYSAIITNERNAIVVTNKTFNLIDFNLGYKNFLDLNWALSYEFNFRNNFATKETFSGSRIFEIDQSYSYSLGATPEYTFLETRKWNLITEISASLVFPQKTAYGQSQVGYSYGAGAKTTYKLNESRIYAGLNYEDRTYNSSEAAYKNKELIYSVGCYYLY